MSSTGLYRTLILASLLVPAGLFAAAAVQNRADVMRESQDTLVRTAAIMDEHARKVFETGELVLALVDDHTKELSWQEISDPATSAFLARLKASLEQVVSIWISDANGTVHAGSQAWNPAQSIAEREFFRAQREADRGAFISGAFRGRATDTASFAISRRRSTSDGRFDGVIHIALSPAYFVRTYKAILPEVEHVASLVRSDGEVLAREPPSPMKATVYPASSPFMQQIVANPGGGFAIGRSTLDGTERAFAHRRVGSYPVHVGLGVPTSVLLDRWRENLKLYGAAAGVAALMLLFASWLALRGMRAERATLARLHVALEDLQHETQQRHAAEQRMRQAEKMEAVGKLTGGIAHDFNNLLTAVLGSLQLLRKRIPTGDLRATRLLANAVRGAERGAALTQRLLAFSRGQVLKPSAVALPALMQEMLPLLRSSLGVGIELASKMPAGLPPARVDANQLELAVLNLALNARDAMPDGGRIEFAARPEQVGAGELAPGRYVVLSVSDTGEGMDAATLARCVEPFYTTKGIGKGTGLGLSMVHGLAAQSGGRLVLRSRKGEGTTAEIWLPEAGAEDIAGAARDEPGPAAAPPQRSTGSVLLVDDDTLVLATAGPMLEDLGYEVHTASSGWDAVELVRAGAKVDLVITDQAMPGLSGVETASALHALRPDLPVLIASGYVERTDLLAAGLPLLDKPFDQQTLAEAVHRLAVRDGADAAE